MRDNRRIIELPYQPPVTAAGGNPAPHSSARATASSHVGDGQCHLNWHMTQGTGGTAGSGAYRWAIPAGLRIDLAATPVGTRVGGALINGTTGSVVVAGERALALDVNGEVASDWQGFDLTGTWTFDARIPVL